MGKSYKSDQRIREGTRTRGRLFLALNGGTDGIPRETSKARMKRWLREQMEEEMEDKMGEKEEELLQY